MLDFLCRAKPVGEGALFCKGRASQVVLVVKNLPANAARHKRHGLNPWLGKIPWRRTWQPTPVFLPRETHGQRSLVGYGL